MDNGFGISGSENLHFFNSLKTISEIAYNNDYYFNFHILRCGEGSFGYAPTTGYEPSGKQQV
ncbi:MAG: hypothetical protein NMNS02_30150 [Nitrosomonas sp.]|nr:MAG: hypothetical protein NMNS02_30150 [Nitrosomonas sp.]